LYPSTGNEIVYSFTGNGASRTITLTPAATLDASLWVTTDCLDYDGLACVAGADDGVEGDAETLSLPTTNGTMYYVVADAYGAGSCGTFTLSIQ
jgi:hypothetical protein